MTPTPCRVAGGVISIRPTYSCTRACMCCQGNTPDFINFGLATWN